MVSKAMYRFYNFLVKVSPALAGMFTGLCSMALTITGGKVVLEATDKTQVEGVFNGWAGSLWDIFLFSWPYAVIAGLIFLVIGKLSGLFGKRV